MKKTLFFLILGLVILVLFSFYFWFYQARYFIGRASVSQSSFSVENSYLFVTPLRANANGQEKIRATVFILNNQGLGVSNKKVILTDNVDLKLDIIQGLTDNYGKAIFDISTNKAGEYYLDVQVDGRSLPQKIHITFN